MVRLVTKGGRKLAPARISTGDIVAIREQKGREALSDSSRLSSITEGVIKALNETSVEVACDEPLGDDFDDTSTLAVTKISSDITHKRYTNSLGALEKAADDPTHDSFSLIQTLFGISPPRFHQHVSLNARQKQFMGTLNETQKEAVINAVKARDLAVIHGPPGTGKTHTLIAYIMIEVLRGSRVLVVAPSNVAVDNIAERLALVEPSPGFVRAGHPARIMPKVLKHSLEYQVQQTDEAKLAEDIRKELNELERKDRKACDRTKRYAIRAEKRQLRKELRAREKSAVRRLLSRKDIILSTISGAGARVLDIAEASSSFDVVVVDEAAQALEAACWVSLLRARKAVLAGDPHQLAGTVKSPLAQSRGLQRSILDRVFSCESLKPTICMLVTQYRMNALISTWSSQEFYDNRLHPDASVASRRVIDLDSCSKKKADNENLIHPFIIIDTAGGDCEEYDQSLDREIASSDKRRSVDLNASKSNQGESHILIEVVNSFIECGIPLQDIAVISPYSGQVELLRNEMWPKHGRSLEIATIDSFQGREKEIVCMSLVRSNEAGEVGFLRDDRRMNVAITRAKRCVVVICDSETISTHPMLARMVEYVETHGLYQSAVVDFPEIIGTFSQSRRPKEAIEAEKKANSRRTTRAPQKRLKADDTRNQVSRREVSLEGGKNVSAENEDTVRETRIQLSKEIELFTQDALRSEMNFSAALSAFERRVVHELAEESGLGHKSIGENNERRIKLWKLEVLNESAIQKDARAIDTVPGFEILRSSSGTEENKTRKSMTSERKEIDTEATLGRNGFDEGCADEPLQASPYTDINSVLRDLSIAREGRGAITEQEPKRTSKAKKKGKKSKKERKTKDDEDFDAILAEYGAQANEGSSSRFTGPVAQIVDGRLTTAVTAPKSNGEARRRLAGKLTEEADKRKRKQKR